LLGLVRYPLRIEAGEDRVTSRRFGMWMSGKGGSMSEPVPGDDLYLWQTEYEGLEESLRTEPLEALPEFLDLVERMLAAAGYDDVPGAANEPEISARLERARELVRLRDAGEPVANDDAFQAAAELRTLYRLVLDHPEADARADFLAYVQGKPLS
jgi:hypothetical protein